MTHTDITGEMSWLGCWSMRLPFSKVKVCVFQTDHRGRLQGRGTSRWTPKPCHLPSGKRLHSYGKSPFLMGSSTINGHVQVRKLLVFQRVPPVIIHFG